MKPEKLILFTLVCIAFISSAQSAQGQAKTETPQAKVMAMENKWNDAYRRSDVAAMNSLLPDDFIITVEDGSTYGKEGYVAHCSDPNVHVNTAELSDVKVRMHGNTAIVTGAYHEQGTNKNKPYELHDRFTDVWMNNGGTWQVIASHYAVPAK